jgi:NADH-quinone oxidoreductase subunit B
VIALGSCAMNGGMYWDSYNTIKRLDKYIPVDIYVAGCMPRPEGIMNAFLKLMKLIDEGKARGWERYKKYYEQYKKNQEMVFNFVKKEEKEEEENEGD